MTTSTNTTLIKGAEIDRDNARPANVVGFNYSAIEAEKAEALRGHATAVLTLARKTAANMIAIGEHLHDARELLPKGTFNAWVKAELRITTAHAYSLISIAEKWADHADELDGLVPTALVALSRSYVPEVARREAVTRAAGGETITPAVAEEIVTKHSGEWVEPARGPKPRPKVATQLRNSERQLVNKIGERLATMFYIDKKVVLLELFGVLARHAGENDVRMAMQEFAASGVAEELGIIE